MFIEPTRQPAHRFQVFYRSLFREGRGMAFPCDPEGRVDLAALSERARQSYFVTRVRVGRDFATPEVLPCGAC